MTRRPPRLDDRAWLEHAYLAEARPLADIAAQLSCSPNTVNEAVRRLGLPRRRPGRHRQLPQLGDAVWLARQVSIEG